MPQQRVVSSAYLAAGASPGLSELEFGLTLSMRGFEQWMVRCMAAAGMPGLSPMDVLTLHTVRHRERPKRLADIALALDIEEPHIADYSVRKLEGAKLAATSRAGKDKMVAATEHGVAVRALRRHSRAVSGRGRARPRPGRCCANGDRRHAAGQETIESSETIGDCQRPCAPWCGRMAFLLPEIRGKVLQPFMVGHSERPLPNRGDCVQTGLLSGENRSKAIRPAPALSRCRTPTASSFGVFLCPFPRRQPCRINLHRRRARPRHTL